MVLTASDAWKLALAALLGGGILLSAHAKAPVRVAPTAELRRLVLCALALYAVGAVASLTHHPALAGLVYAAGITICTLAAWLSRGSDTEEPPGEPAGEWPPPDPEGAPKCDWEAFERSFQAYSDSRNRDRDPAGV